MKGKSLVDDLRRRLKPPSQSRPLTYRQLASALGVTSVTLSNWRNRKTLLTSRQVTNLVASAMKSARATAERNVIKPIVEFLDLEADDSRSGKKMELFSPKLLKEHPYLRGLKKELEENHGIYIFYDSRGRALYAGKALRRSLWSELKDVFNRAREVQKIRRVKHPFRRVAFRTHDKKSRQIRSNEVTLYELADYVSAYVVPTGLINTLEALLVRGFANDLLNVRMERFARPTARNARKRRRRKKK